MKGMIQIRVCVNNIHGSIKRKFYEFRGNKRRLTIRLNVIWLRVIRVWEEPAVCILRLEEWKLWQEFPLKS
jgi:hypothetical protein